MAIDIDTIVTLELAHARDEIRVVEFGVQWLRSVAFVDIGKARVMVARTAARLLSGT